MPCCGQSRESIQAAESASRAASEGIPSNGAALVGPAATFQRPVSTATPDIVTLRSRDRGATVVTGPVSGKRYRFAAGMAMLAVDRRDAANLVDTGLFERVWG